MSFDRFSVIFNKFDKFDKIFLKYKRASILFLLFVILSSINGCTYCKTHKKPRTAHFQEISFNNIEMWVYDDHNAALKTFQKSCQAIMKKQAHKNISSKTKLGGHCHIWQNICRKAISIPTNGNGEAARLFFENNFKVYKVMNEKNKAVGKFTGYYEIEMNGSRVKTKQYKHPVYKLPPNICQLKGKNSLKHSAINRGSLNGKKLEIAWVDNKARLFFMHIQGSGVIKLPNKTEMKVGYAGENGFPYTAIGPYFKEYTTNHIGSAVDMINWLHKNPKIGQQIMEKNESYVFFQERPHTYDGPIGAQGIPLTRERSVALDSGIFPYGMPLWIETKLPNTSHMPSRDFHRLMIAQDTGGAIKGAVRADIFFGRGSRAEELAGYMSNNGVYYALFPNGVDIPSVYVTS